MKQVSINFEQTQLLEAHLGEYGMQRAHIFSSKQRSEMMENHRQLLEIKHQSEIIKYQLTIFLVWRYMEVCLYSQSKVRDKLLAILNMSLFLRHCLKIKGTWLWQLLQKQMKNLSIIYDCYKSWQETQQLTLNKIRTIYWRSFNSYTRLKSEEKQSRQNNDKFIDFKEKLKNACE